MPDQRNLTRTLLVNRGAVKTQETMSANHFTCVVKPLNQHQVGMDGTVDSRALERFGEQKNIRLQQTLTNFGRRLSKIQPRRTGLFILSNAQLSPLNQLPMELIALLDQFELLIAETQEVILLHPLQESGCFGLLLGCIGCTHRVD